MQLSKEQRESFNMELLQQMYTEAMSWQPGMPELMPTQDPLAMMLEQAKQGSA